jgi:glycosyltransferase 2 family protein
MQHGTALTAADKVDERDSSVDTGAPLDDPREAREAREAPRAAWERSGPKLLLSVLFGAGIAWVLARGGLPLLPPRSALSALRPWVIPAYLTTLLAQHYFRAIRWRYLLRPVGQVSDRSAVAVSWIAFAAILILPLRSGEIVRPYLITRRSSVRLWEAMGTIGAERVIDGLALSLILFAGLAFSTPLSPLPDHVGELPVPVAAVPRAAYLALFVFGCAFTAMGVFFFARDFAQRATRAAGRIISDRLADRLAGIVLRVADGLRFLPSARLFAPFLLETLLYWGVNAAGVFLLAWGTGLTSVTLAESAVIMGCIGIGILVPAGPGFFGAFQLSTYMALAMFFPEEALRGPGAGFVFLLYVCQVGFHLVAAGLGFAIDARGPRAPITAA